MKNSCERVLRHAVKVSVMLGLGLAVTPLHAQQWQPNVILVLVDDQGWTGTSVQMDAAVPTSKSDLYRTPSLEKFASEGVRFSSGYSSAPNCSPARMSIQTGKTSSRLKSTDITAVHPANYDQEPYGRRMYEVSYVNKPLLIELPASELDPDELTIAELLKISRPEYVSAHFGKWHLGTPPDQHGYDAHSGNTSNVEGDIGEPDPKRTSEVTRQAIEFLQDQSENGQPFFMQVSYYAVHTPLLARETSIEGIQHRQKKMREDGVGVRGRLSRHRDPVYAAMTEELDEGFGDLMRAVDELGLADNTYVIYTSDNGAEIQNTFTTNAPLARGKTSVWEGGIRVPFLVRGPGVLQDKQVDWPVVGHDILPTIAEWTGMQSLPDDLDGQSFAKVLVGPDQSVSERDQGLIWYYGAYRNAKYVSPQMAMRKGRFKLYWDIQNDRVSLFDLSLDLGETTNLSSFHETISNSMLEELKAYMAGVGVDLPERNENYDPAKDLGLTIQRRQSRNSENGASRSD